MCLSALAVIIGGFDSDTGAVVEPSLGDMTVNNKKTWLGLIISAVFLYLAFRKTDWAQTWEIVRTIDFFWLLASLPVLLLTFWLRAVRWRYLLLPAGRPTIHSLFGALMIGFMSLNLLPLRLGEFIRAYVLGRRENLSKSGVFATVVLERVFDGFTVLLFLITALFLQPMPLPEEAMAWIRAFSYLAVLIFVCALVFLVLARLKTDFLVMLAEKLLSPLPRFQNLASRLIISFASGMDALASPRLIAWAFLHSILVWASTTAFYWVVMFAFSPPGGQSLGATVGPVGSVIVLGAIALGIMIPSSPGFVGTFELACITAMVALGVERSIAGSYAIIVHITQFIPITVTGIVYLYLQNFSLREISDGGRTAKQELEPDA